MKKLHALLAALTAALALAGTAGAHVTVHPNALPSGSFTVVNVRVPNERPQSTTKVDVQLPSGILFLSYQPVPGWKAKVTYRKLAKPVTMYGEQITREVDRVTWTGGRIAAGQFVEFPLSISVPSRPAGTVLTFKAVQTYAGGEVVRWIGSPTADQPAPQVLVRGKDTAVADYPNVAAARKARSTSGVHPAIGAAIALPLLGLGLLARRRRRA